VNGHAGLPHYRVAADIFDSLVAAVKAAGREGEW
jgi:hypothetical protein